jgi:serine protease Do
MLRRFPHPARLAGPTPVQALALLVGALLLLGSANASELRKTPIVRAVERARPSIVNIKGEKTVAEGVDATGKDVAGRRVNGMGTGVMVDSRGYVLTNYHVVAGVREIQVTLDDSCRYMARLVDHDPETDLAVIKIDSPKSLPVIDMGTSSDLMPGETVVAVGNAYGYEHTVTRGIISALHRAVQVSDAQYYDDLIQTDASINPGNSGGPLLNIDGEMIGLNVAVRAGAQGIGFAIPVDKAMDVAAKLLAAENARHVWHGLALTAADARSEGGPRVSAVERNSPAEKAGVRIGDVITAAGDGSVVSRLDFQRALLGRKPGETLDVSVHREGETVEMPLCLADVPDKGETWSLLGLELEGIAEEAFNRRYQARYRGGLMVKAVRPGSPAAAQGIMPGDVLVGMHVWETVSLDNVSYVLKRSDLESFSPVKFFILREGETLYGYLPVSARTARRP